MSRAAAEVRRLEPAAGDGCDLVALCSDEDAPLLIERARQLARPKAAVESRGRRESYIRLRVGTSAQYGIPYRNAEEILYVSAISRVPCAPDFVRGVINRRGDMLAVLDLKALFEVEGPDDARDARVVVVSAAGMTLGLLVDEVLDNDEFDPEHLDPPLAASRIPRTEHVLGLHEGTVAVLDLDALLGDGALFNF